MRQFAIRFSAFTLLWLFFIFFAYNESSSLSLIITLFATSLTVHFFIPIVKKPLFLCLLGQLIIIFTLFWTSSFEYMLPLIALSLLEGAFHLQTRPLWVLVVVSFVLVLPSLIYTHTSYAISGLFVLFGIGCLFLNRYINETKEKRELYEELLGEYRSLKRTSLQQEEVVRLEERTRVARDIHDSVGHKLTALLMQLEMDSMTGNYPNIVELKKLARESLEETRHAVRQLKQEEITGIQSVILLIRKLESESHLLVRFITEKGALSIPLTNEQSITLYRMLQEALTNAMKHGASREVEVTLRQTSTRCLQFLVGNKVSSVTPIEMGFGLTNMKARVEELGGELRILRTEEHFQIEGSFPLKEN
ncbi:sensor histidine kinase [Psychrobacillus glaciei]|uniref:histidine kinase n=1 Tax=Psychrobacillus glaciei TaxID=2283160 RepID=A0A5J6SK73_9BACI|nr:sensor histidine kinase [Psychrobacillus glaciei]QFF97843.1 sensor histidine kinase [Psychrobacillus glaciei]